MFTSLCPTDVALIVRTYIETKLCFIVKRLPGVSQEFIYNVSPSTIIHVSELNEGFFF